VGTMGGYLGALLLAPLITLIFIGTGFVSPLKLLVTLLELIIGPLILGQVVVRAGWTAKVEPFKGSLTNWSFFLINYTMVGLNREIFLHQWTMLLPVIVIGLVSTFGAGWVVERVGRAFGVREERVVSMVLLATLKNYGLAGGLALFFFGEATAVPATVLSVVGIIYFIVLEWARKRGRG
jgi:bile acid:Na+ symporter, BASS family